MTLLSVLPSSVVVTRFIPIWPPAFASAIVVNWLDPLTPDAVAARLLLDSDRVSLVALVPSDAAVIDTAALSSVPVMAPLFACQDASAIDGLDCPVAVDPSSVA